MKFETVELTAEQERAWNNVMRMMEWTAPIPVSLVPDAAKSQWENICHHGAI